MGPDFERVLGEHVGGFDPEVLAYRCLCLETFAEPEDYRAHVAAELSAALAEWLRSNVSAELMHEAIDGDFLMNAGGPGVDIGINDLGANDVVRWARAALAADSGGVS